MLKNYRIDSAIKRAVARVSLAPINRITEKYGEIIGREEDITSKLEERLGVDLVDEVEKQLNGTKIKGLSFDIFTHKKKQEKASGADVLGIVDIQLNGKQTKKAYLAQCKVGKIVGHSSDYNPVFKCTSSMNILAQAEKMLATTSDSFFFIYTKEGIFVISAFQIRLCNKSGSIDSNEVYFKPLSTFYSDFFKCFIGDEKIADQFNSKGEFTFRSGNKLLFEQMDFSNLTYVTIKQV